MTNSADDTPRFLNSSMAVRGWSTLSVCSFAFLLVILALQRGGYYPESWGLPTAACGWIVAVIALLGGRQRMRPIEHVPPVCLGLLGVWALTSSTWAPGGLGSTLSQAQLAALYGVATAAIFIVFRRATLLVVATWMALVAVSLFALGTRLFPSSGRFSDTASGNRLYAPLGYWNSLGLWAAMALALGLVLAARSRTLPLRAVAAASCVPSAVTLYFTFSRGAWIALAIGLLAAFVVDPRRLGFAGWSMLGLAWPAAGVFLASRADALTTTTPVLGQAREAGHSLSLGLLVISTCAALTACGAGYAERRWLAPRSMRLAFASVLTVISAAVGAGVMVKFGLPWTIAIHGAREFAGSTPPHGSDLNARLFDASGSARIDLWRVAWDDATRHWLRGSGAGSYESEWFRARPVPVDVTNAHSLYLETLAEMGPLGLGLLVAALGTPLLAVWRARRHPLMAGALASYVAFLVHAAADWDWQLGAVGLAGLACGAALLVMARRSRSSTPRMRERMRLAAAGVALAAFGLWSLYVSYPLGQARDAADAGHWKEAEVHARRATERIGGSSELAWRLLGEAQTARRETSDARVSLRTAARRDPSSWEAWYDLALVTHGKERRTSAHKALELNPLGADTISLATASGIVAAAK